MVTKRIILIVLSLTSFTFLCSCSSQKNPTSTESGSSQTSRTLSSTSATSTSTPSNTSDLSEAKVEKAAKKAFSKLQQDGQMDSGVKVRVIGVQELPSVSGAKTDLELTNALFLPDDLLRGHWEVGKGNFGGRRVYNKKSIRIENYTAIIKHYTNGRWVLESLDTHSYEFGVIPVNIEFE